MVVLTIDDDPEDLDNFFRAAKMVNPFAKCLLARNAREALHIVKDTLLPDYIFLDLRMPIMDGKKVLAELRKMKRLRLVPVIMFSSLINPRDRDELIALGATDFLTKPRDFFGLCDALSGILKRK